MTEKLGYSESDKQAVENLRKKLVKKARGVVPLGSYLGWNLRRAAAGAPARLGRWRGAFLPFALDKRHAGARGDPRPSILERYPTRDRFLERTGAATQDLVRRRLLLAEDEGAVLGRAGALYDALMDADAPRNCTFAVP